MSSSASKDQNTSCHCPTCSPTPAYTYTEEFRMECLAREFGHYSDEQRNTFLLALKRQKCWEERLHMIEALIDKLKVEGRYETEFWKVKAKSKDSE